MAEATGTTLDRNLLADECGSSNDALAEHLSELERLGLIVGDGDGTPPVLLRAGRQYLALGCEFDAGALGFLPHAIDDLYARRALLCGGTVLVDEFRGALIAGNAVEYARDVVPPAFATAVGDVLVLDLFAAAVALMARLSAGQPAACVAEEIIAVSLIDHARMWLELERDGGEITREVASAATEALSGLFELFEDDDVLRLFDMREPADAAVDGRGPTAATSVSPTSDSRPGSSRSAASHRPDTSTIATHRHDAAGPRRSTCSEPPSTLAQRLISPSRARGRGSAPGSSSIDGDGSVQA